MRVGLCVRGLWPVVSAGREVAPTGGWAVLAQLPALRARPPMAKVPDRPLLGAQVRLQPPVVPMSLTRLQWSVRSTLPQHKRPGLP